MERIHDALAFVVMYILKMLGYMLQYLKHAWDFALWCLSPLRKTFRQINHNRIQKQKVQILAEEENLIDPFVEIAKNRLDTTIYSSNGNSAMPKAFFSAVARIAEAYKTMGRRPVVLLISANDRVKELSDLNMCVVEIPILEDDDPLATALKIQSTFSEPISTAETLVLHVSFSPGMRITKEQQLQDVFSFVLPIIINDPTHICQVVIPYRQQNDHINNMLADMEKKHRTLCLQYINPCDYALVDREIWSAPNRIMFPMYHADMDQHRLNRSVKAFPKVNVKHIVRPFWKFYQAIYDVNGESGVYFMDKNEIRDTDE